MRKVIFGFLLLGASIPGLTGCTALLVGAAGAGGAALWQGGKVISEENTTLKRAVSAVKAAFKRKNITLKSEVSRVQVVQLRGENTAGKKVAVDVFKTGPKNVRIEIRVGLGEEAGARDLLNEIKKRI